MSQPESNVGRVRDYLKSIQGIMEESSCTLSADDIADAVGLTSDQIVKILQNNAILPPDNGLFVLDKDAIIQYERARGPHELFEPKCPEDPQEVPSSRNFTGIDSDPTG